MVYIKIIIRKIKSELGDDDLDADYDDEYDKFFESELERIESEEIKELEDVKLQDTINEGIIWEGHFSAEAIEMLENRKRNYIVGSLLFFLLELLISFLIVVYIENIIIPLRNINMYLYELVSHFSFLVFFIISFKLVKEIFWKRILHFNRLLDDLRNVRYIITPNVAKLENTDFMIKGNNELPLKDIVKVKYNVIQYKERLMSSFFFYTESDLKIDTEYFLFKTKVQYKYSLAFYYVAEFTGVLKILQELLSSDCHFEYSKREIF